MPVKKKSRKIVKEQVKAQAGKAKSGNKEDSEGRAGLEKQEKQLRKILIIMAAVLFLVFAFYTLSIKLKNFEYAGLQFEKIKQNGKVIYYVAKVPVADNSGKIADYLSVYMREDPRKLGRIGISGDIKIKKTISLAASSETIESCEDSVLAGTTLALFLNKIGGSTFTATTNKTEAEEKKRNYVNCSDASDYTMVLFENGDESSIHQKENCYVLTFANAEIMNVTERFIVGIYAHANGIELK